MPIQVVITNRQAAWISTFFQALIRIMIAIVVAPIAVNGVATCKPTTIANSGMAINASPNPNADLMKVDKKRIDSTSKVVEEKSISFQ